MTVNKCEVNCSLLPGLFRVDETVDPSEQKNNFKEEAEKSQLVRLCSMFIQTPFVSFMVRYLFEMCAYEGDGKGYFGIRCVEYCNAPCSFSSHDVSFSRFATAA